MDYNVVFALTAIRLAEIHGTPLGKDVFLLCNKNPKEGWQLLCNMTDEETHNIPPMSIQVTYNGWPAGLINIVSGFVAAGEAANERDLIHWLLDQVDQSDKTVQLILEQIHPFQPQPARETA